MIKLMKLELKRNNIKTYVIAGAVTCIVMIAFLYLFAYAPHIDPDPELQIFAGYDNIISLFSVLSTAVFATLSATMYTRFIIDEYRDRKPILLFSYPVRRDKILFSKLLVVFLFTVTSMIISNILIFTVFSVSESISPLVNDTLTVRMMIKALKITIIMAITAGAIGIVATGIGFLKKSVPTTILSGVLLSSLFCNIMFSLIEKVNENETVVVIFMSITLLISMAVSIILKKKINCMEVE